MSRMIFVNLPVKDLDASKAFFGELGFSCNERYTDDKGACVVVFDDIFVMLLTEEFFATFVNGPVADANAATEVLLCLSCDSREQVDETLAKAIAAGGKPWKPVAEQGPMYGASFSDLDGHVWELAYMAGA